MDVTFPVSSLSLRDTAGTFAFVRRSARISRSARRAVRIRVFTLLLPSRSTCPTATRQPNPKAPSAAKRPRQTRQAAGHSTRDPGRINARRIFGARAYKQQRGEFPVQNFLPIYHLGVRPWPSPLHTHDAESAYKPAEFFILLLSELSRDAQQQQAALSFGARIGRWLLA